MSNGGRMMTGTMEQPIDLLDCSDDDDDTESVFGPYEGIDIARGQRAVSNVVDLVDEDSSSEEDEDDGGRNDRNSSAIRDDQKGGPERKGIGRSRTLTAERSESGDDGEAANDSSGGGDAPPREGDGCGSEEADAASRMIPKKRRKKRSNDGRTNDIDKRLARACRKKPSNDCRNDIDKRLARAFNRLRKCRDDDDESAGRNGAGHTHARAAESSKSGDDGDAVEDFLEQEDASPGEGDRSKAVAAWKKRKKRKKKPRSDGWTDDRIGRLVRAYDQLGAGHWIAIARYVGGGFTNEDCRNKINRLKSEGAISEHPSNLWTEDEVRRLNDSHSMKSEADWDGDNVGGVDWLKVSILVGNERLSDDCKLKAFSLMREICRPYGKKKKLLAVPSLADRHVQGSEGTHNTVAAVTTGKRKRSPVETRRTVHSREGSNPPNKEYAILSDSSDDDASLSKALPCAVDIPPLKPRSLFVSPKDATREAAVAHVDDGMEPNSGNDPNATGKDDGTEYKWIVPGTRLLAPHGTKDKLYDVPVLEMPERSTDGVWRVLVKWSHPWNAGFVECSACRPHDGFCRGSGSGSRRKRATPDRFGDLTSFPRKWRGGKLPYAGPKGGGSGKIVMPVGHKRDDQVSSAASAALGLQETCSSGNRSSCNLEPVELNSTRDKADTAERQGRVAASSQLPEEHGKGRLDDSNNCRVNNPSHQPDDAVISAAATNLGSGEITSSDDSSSCNLEPVELSSNQDEADTVERQGRAPASSELSKEHRNGHDNDDDDLEVSAEDSLPRPAAKGAVGTRRKFHLAVEVVGDKRQSDSSGVGVVAKQRLFPKDKFLIDFGARYHPGKPPDTLVRSKSDRYIAFPQGYFYLVGSMTEWMNEARGDKLPNIQWTMSYSPEDVPAFGTTIMSLRWKVLREIQEGEELLTTYLDGRQQKSPTGNQ